MAFHEEKGIGRLEHKLLLEVFVGLKQCKNSVELLKISDVILWVIHIETKLEERRVSKTQFYVSPVL